MQPQHPLPSQVTPRRKIDLIIYPAKRSDLRLWAKFYHTKLHSSFCTARLGLCNLAQEEGRRSGLLETQELGLWEFGHLGCEACETSRTVPVPSALDTGFLEMFELAPTHSLGCRAAGPCWALHAGHATALCHSRYPGCLFGHQYSCRIHDSTTALSATGTTHLRDCQRCC